MVVFTGIKKEQLWKITEEDKNLYHKLKAKSQRVQNLPKMSGILIQK